MRVPLFRLVLARACPNDLEQRYPQLAPIGHAFEPRSKRLSQQDEVLKRSRPKMTCADCKSNFAVFGLAVVDRQAVPVEEGTESRPMS